MTAQDHQETPATAAGRRLADLIDNDDMILDTGAYLVSLIEKEAAEAAARQVTRLQAFEDTLADIDREPTPEEVRKYGLDGSPGTSFNTLQWKLDRFRLLSAGDKAEAPLVTSEGYRAKSGDWGRD